MESPVEHLVKEISREMSDLLMRKVYVAIMDRIGQVYYADDQMDQHVDFCTTFVKNNFTVLDVGDHSIPLSNINLIFFKTSENFATILFTKAGRVGQLLAFKRKMDAYGQKIETALSEFITDIEKIEKIEHELYGAPPSIPSAKSGASADDVIEEVIEDYEPEEFTIPEEVIEPIKGEETVEPSEILDDLITASTSEIPSIPEDSVPIPPEEKSIPAPMTPPPAPMTPPSEPMPSLSAPVEPPAPAMSTEEVYPPASVPMESAWTATPTETAEPAKPTIKVVPVLTRSLRKKDKFDIKTGIVIRFCDGKNTIEEVAQKADLSRSEVDDILNLWEKKGLIKLRVEHTRVETGAAPSYNLFPKIGQVSLTMGFDEYEQAVLGLCDGRRTLDIIAQELNYDRNYIVSVIKKYEESDWMEIIHDGDVDLYPINLKTIEPSAVQLGLISKKEFQIRELSDGEHSVSDISLNLGVKPKDVQKILEKLKKKGIVRMKVKVQ